MTIAEQTLQLKKDFDDVYTAGVEAGKASGGDYDSAFAAGVKSEYDRFWDSYQDNGNRTDHSHAFAGKGWNNENFKPKYDIKIDSSQGAYMLFRYAQIEGDLIEILEDLGIDIIYNNNSSFNYAFQDSKFSRLGELFGKNATYDMAFLRCYNLETIDGITSSTGYFTKFSNTFGNCTALKNITFNSIIECNLDIHWSKSLSAESLKNIIEHLSDTSSGFTVTLPNTAEATYDAVHGEGAWLEFAGDGTEAHPGIRPNWSIAYI